MKYIVYETTKVNIPNLLRKNLCLVIKKVQVLKTIRYTTTDIIIIIHTTK